MCRSTVTNALLTPWRLQLDSASLSRLRGGRDEGCGIKFDSGGNICYLPDEVEGIREGDRVHEVWGGGGSPCG